MPLSIDHPAPLSAFIVASLLLGLSPGPGVLYVVTQSVMHGRAHGLASAAAMAVGNFIVGLCAALGLHLLMNLSGSLFAVMRYAGAVYLFYMGLKAILAKPPPAVAAAPPPAGRTFTDGLMVALLNPKTLLFFAAFLPQFMDVHAPSATRGAMLVAIFCVIALGTDSGYALVAGQLAKPLQHSRRVTDILRMTGGVILMLLGLAAALY